MTEWTRKPSNLFLYQKLLEAYRLCARGKPSLKSTDWHSREVIAANIRDRVVHRLVYEYMSPYWQKRFLPFSFACRACKGPLAAVKEVEDVIRRHRCATSVPLHALKVDVSRFFPSICHEVLLAIVGLCHEADRALKVLASWGSC